VKTTVTTGEADWTNLDLPRPKGAMPLVNEWMTPWIGAAFLVAIITVTYVARGNQLPMLEQTLLAVGLCATLTAAGLVVLRCNRKREVSLREERARPAIETLDGADGGRGGNGAYVEGMQRWTVTTLELLEHARGCAPDGSPVATDLEAALVDTRELSELLFASGSDALSIHETATIHAVCTLWEANLDRVEQLAESLDPLWYRCWRARAVADRRLRHGDAVCPPMAIRS
jgi:hypothetical protein